MNHDQVNPLMEMGIEPFTKPSRCEDGENIQAITKAEGFTNIQHNALNGNHLSIFLLISK